MLSDLQVDVNGLETFYVSKIILASFSGRLRKMFGKSASNNKVSLKLVFQDFPGGAEGFELIVRFCYNGGRIDITPSNMVLLHSAAKYLEIDEDHTTKYCQNGHFFTWSELLDCLKQCQEFLSFMCSSSIVEEILNAVVEKIFMPNVSSPLAFSGITQFSGDVSSSSNCSRSSSFQTINWLRDLEFLNTHLFDKVVNTMISQKLDNGVVCSFLLHYQRVKFMGFLQAENKCKIIEIVITSLCSLDGGFRLFPFRSLCDMLRACLTLKMGKCWVKKVERMIGSRLDEATLDDLLISCHGRKAWAYNVDMILRFLKAFLGERERRRKVFVVQRLRRVGFLMDLYLAEVAPDPHLKPQKFLALALALPDSARECHDSICEVISLYFKVQKFINEEEKIRICAMMNADKLSSESIVNLAKNAEFPACVAAAAQVIMQSKLKNLSSEEKSVEFKWNTSLFADEDEQIVSEGKERRKVQKKSSNSAKINVMTCPKSATSLPRLCS